MSDPIDFELDWDPAFGDPAGETVSVRDAAEIIIKRLKLETKESWSVFDFGGHKNTFIDTGDGKLDIKGSDRIKFAEQLVALLPEDMRTPMVLQRMDIRALLEPVLVTADDDGDTEIAGQKFSADDRRNATLIFAHLGRQTQNELYTQLAKTMDPGSAQAIAQEQAQFTRGTIRPVSMEIPDAGSYSESITAEASTVARAEDGSITTSNGPSSGGFGGDLNLYLGGEEALERPAFFTEADIDMFFRTGTADEAIDKYLYESSRRQGFNDERQSAFDAGMSYSSIGPEAPRDSMRIQYRDEVDPTRQRALGPGGNSMNLAPNTKKWDRKQYTLTETLNLPNTMSRQELKTLTDRMRDAGLFEGRGEPASIGNPADQNFKQAWRELISQSVQLDKPMWELLGESIKGREDVKAEARDSFTAKLSDPASIRLTAQSLARQMLGRRISDEEAEALVGQIHKWESEAQFAAFDASTAEPGERDAEGNVLEVDWEARMAEVLRAENPDEAAAKDQVNQYETFRTMIGGPGYGPTRRGVNQ